MRDVALLPKIIGTTKGGKSMQSKSSQYLRLAAVPACLLTATLAHAGQNAPLCTDLPFAYTAADVELTSATLVAAVAGRNPEYCDVRGTINRHIKFAVFLPTEWNQRFQMVGNGGKAGTISLSDMATAVANGFATSSTDTGHDAASPIEARVSATTRYSAKSARSISAGAPCTLPPRCPRTSSRLTTLSGN
jgi:hypothetical protein